MRGFGALVGLIFGIGGVIGWIGVQRGRRAPMRRIDPYIARAASPDAEGLSAVYAALAQPLGEWAAGRLPHMRQADEALRIRLLRAGYRGDVVAYRYSQLASAALGLALALGLLLSKWAGGGDLGPVQVVLMLCFGTACGWLIRDQLLSRDIAARQKRIQAQFPAVAELLALAVAAGESPGEALARVSRRNGGELGHELRIAAEDIHEGSTLSRALSTMADRLSVPSISRFVDGLVLAVERGTPLSEVLRAQARDARDQSHRQLIEMAGRRDALMLAPIVFLVLPTVVLVALFPGLGGLGLTLSG